MKKKFAAFVLCVICLLSAAGCGQTKTDEQTPPVADQSTTTDDYLTTISGTYVELFPELSKSEYRNICCLLYTSWHRRLLGRTHQGVGDSGNRGSDAVHLKSR